MGRPWEREGEEGEEVRGEEGEVEEVEVVVVDLEGEGGGEGFKSRGE